MLRLILAVLILFAVPALGQQAPEDVDARIDSVLGDHVPYEAAFVDLRAAVEANNAEALAALIPYGTPIFLNGEQVTLADEAEFKARVAEFLTEEVKAAVMAQTYETLFVNANGIMFGTGQLWLGGTCTGESCTDPAVRIIAINTAKGNG